MPKTSKKRNSPKAVLHLPDLTQAKSGVRNTLTSVSAQRCYEEIVRISVESSGSGFHMLTSSGNAGNSFL